MQGTIGRSVACRELVPVARPAAPRRPGMRRSAVFIVFAALAALLTACGRFHHDDPPAAAGQPAAGGASAAAATSIGNGTRPALGAGGLALLTPTADAGHEEDRQTVALIFTKELLKDRPDLTPVPLSKTLSEINEAGLTGDYQRMYAAYKETGIFDKPLLRKIGEVTGARYLLQLKLAAFDESSSGGSLPIPFVGGLIQRQTASARLYLQLWDSADGTIVWERSDEASEQKRSLIRARSIKLDDVVESASEKLIKQLPRG